MLITICIQGPFANEDPHIQNVSDRSPYANGDPQESPYAYLCIHESGDPNPHTAICIRLVTGLSPPYAYGDPHMHMWGCICFLWVV